MVSFRTFYEENQIGLNEKIHIDGIGFVEAKSDSGNMAYNVLHGTNVVINNDGTATFDTVNNIKLTKPAVETIDINVGSGHKELRPVVEFNIKIGNHSFNSIKFSIANREENETPVLLGIDFLTKIKALVNVNKSNILSDE
jgi:hypothetical protein